MVGNEDNFTLGLVALLGCGAVLAVLLALALCVTDKATWFCSIVCPCCGPVCVNNDADTDPLLSKTARSEGGRRPSIAQYVPSVDAPSDGPRMRL
eukprot:SAG11_NODE_319_length_10822_cov_12.319500_9_plen_95_part_00